MGGFAQAGASFSAAAYSSSESRKAAKDQRRWQKHMAETAYQRTMKDMAAAGLNPILAYQQGATGAGQGATAQVFNPDMSGIGSAMQGMSDVRKKGSGTALDREQVKTEKQKQHLLGNPGIESMNNYMGQDIQNKIQLERIPGAKIEGDIDRSPAGKPMRQLNRASSSARGILPLIGK